MEQRLYSVTYWQVMRKELLDLKNYQLSDVEVDQV